MKNAKNNPPSEGFSFDINKLIRFYFVIYTETLKITNMKNKYSYIVEAFINYFDNNNTAFRLRVYETKRFSFLWISFEFLVYVGYINIYDRSVLFKDEVSGTAFDTIEKAHFYGEKFINHVGKKDVHLAREYPFTK